MTRAGHYSAMSDTIPVQEVSIGTVKKGLGNSQDTDIQGKSAEHETHVGHTGQMIKR